MQPFTSSPTLSEIITWPTEKISGPRWNFEDATEILAERTLQREPGPDFELLGEWLEDEEDPPLRSHVLDLRPSVRPREALALLFALAAGLGMIWAL